MNQIDSVDITAFAGRLETPAFVCDENQLNQSLDRLNRLRETGCRLFYPLKTSSYVPLLQHIAPFVEGFAASSLFEAKLARQFFPGHQVHVTTPGFRPDQLDELAELGDFVALNSLPQLLRFGDKLVSRCSLGLRVNPGLSFADDDRYNPCRRNSKLGAPLDNLQQFLIQQPVQKSIAGLHFHTTFSALSYQPLRQTVELLEKKLPQFLPSLDWVSLGGGYLIDRIGETGPFEELVFHLRQNGRTEVHFEPGKGIVDRCISLVSSVIDIFESDGKQLAVLDTCVNHLPEVFEYQRQPVIKQHNPEAENHYIIVGSSCMAGDVFGEYAFDLPLEIGQQLCFPGAGAYTLVKSHRFNGINLPSVYWLDTQKKLVCQKQYSYQNYQDFWSADR